MKKGSKRVVRREPADTKPVKATVIKNRKRPASIALGVRNKKTPIVVATPLPPLNLRKIEKRCPKTAKNPTPARINSLGKLLCLMK